MKIHVLTCGYIQVSETVPYGNAIDLKNTAEQLRLPLRARVTLPVNTYLIEQPRGLIPVDTGRRREISPAGVYICRRMRYTRRDDPRACGFMSP